MSGIKSIIQGLVLEEDVNYREQWLEKKIDSSMDLSGRAQRGGVFYPSALGNPCDKFLYLHYKGLLPPMKMTPKLRRIFDHGIITQTRYKNYFSKMGVLLEEELSTKLDHPPISGRLDYLLNFPDIGKYIIDLKTINDQEFMSLRKAKTEHEVQVQIYLNLFDAKNGGVLYEDKNNQEIKVFKVTQNKEDWNSIIERCFRIMAMVAPPKLAENHNKYCQCIARRNGKT